MRQFVLHARTIIYLLAIELFARAYKSSRSSIQNKSARRKSWTTLRSKSCCKKFADNYNRSPLLKSDDCPKRRFKVICCPIAWLVASSHTFFAYGPEPQVNSIQVDSVSGSSF